MRQWLQQDPESSPNTVMVQDQSDEPGCLAEEVQVTEQRPHLQVAHVLAALGEDDPGQQQQQRVGHHAVHGLSIQQQAAVHVLQPRRLGHRLALQHNTHAQLLEAAEKTSPGGSPSSSWLR